MPPILMTPHSRIANRAVRSIAKQFHTRLFELGKSANRKILWDYVVKKHALTDATACLKALLPSGIDVTQETVQRHLDGLAADQSLRESLEKHRRLLGKGVPLPTLNSACTEISLFCYVLPRLLKPSTIIETGCATGWMSALFLLALQQNQQGHLYSIDLSPNAGQLSMDWTMPEDVDVGFLVPQELRSRWTLIIGNARVELTPLLERIRTVDLFCHDSDHTYAQMMWEYTSVWPYLASGGVLLSDDIGWNTAFWDFSTAAERPVVVYKPNTNFGALSKS
ncbi:MAG: class I SAM-dependent methyltransferase [Candidatus Omnitrophica bacterium]|nr:class I SAM-dependent methyltransferase [Candidatus Omnitrophota bacterium]